MYTSCMLSVVGSVYPSLTYRTWYLPINQPRYVCGQVSIYLNNQNHPLSGPLRGWFLSFQSLLFSFFSLPLCFPLSAAACLLLFVFCFVQHPHETGRKSLYDVLS